MSEHNQSFITKYLFTIDHKMIARQYTLTGLIMAAIGGYLAYVFRSQLAWPGESIPGFGIMGAGQYNQAVTMHATIMVFWVAMPILLGGFGNFLIPLMVGADDMAFPKLNMASFWVFFVSSVILILSFFVPGGAASGGWTMYPPLSAKSAFSGVEWGANLWIIAVALEIISMLIGGINFITTTINMRAKGLSLFRLPVMLWMEVVANLLFMFSVGPLVAGAVMLLLDRTLGTGFYDPGQGGDPLLFQHLFWFFGHPEVYVILLPGLGIIAEIIPAFTRKTLFGYKTILYSIFIAGILSFVVWAHHQFISGIDPRLALPFSITTILISVPLAVSVLCFIATLWKGSITFSTPMLFALGFLLEFLLGGATGLMLGSPAADIYFHDTYFVVAHFHYTLFPTVIIATFAGIYYWFPKMFGKYMNETLGKIHFAGTILFFNFIFIPQFLMGAQGHHRRIADPTQFDFLQDLQHLQIISTSAVIGLLIFQIPFVFNLFHSIFKGKAAPENPWNATTLEWNTPSPPPHGNFLTPPVVYRDPYEYSIPGADSDFLPQHKS